MLFRSSKGTLGHWLHGCETWVVTKQCEKMLKKGERTNFVGYKGRKKQNCPFGLSGIIMLLEINVKSWDGYSDDAGSIPATL